MIRLFNKSPNQYFTPADQEKVVNAIRDVETKTTGEIRVFAELKNPLKNSLDRAQGLFYKLKMDKTAQRNGVLIYIALKQREIAIYADEGIYNTVPHEFWQKEVNELISAFKKQDYTQGLVKIIDGIGEVLEKYYPIQNKTDVNKNELPDEIIFGNSKND